MGPIALFDKSFLQGLTVDESVWFGHFFSPVVCPLFYVETMADLEKAVREGRTPEQEVSIIAARFPDAGGYPCGYHTPLAINELLGYPVPMDGRIPVMGGRPVQRGGKVGVIYDPTPEEEAFSRWQRGEFLEIERKLAKQWRSMLGQMDLPSIVKQLRALGIDGTTCRSLEGAKALADSIVRGSDNPFSRIALAVAVLNLDRQHEAAIVERWSLWGKKPLAQYAPYTAHVITVELFFQFALGAGLIGAERASNRVDVAYLNYLPFCNVFLSTDNLHRRCAPHFLRADQRFAWGEDVKQDLKLINAHFDALPQEVKDQGVMSFAHAPPKREHSIVRELRAAVFGEEHDDRPPVVPHQRGAEADSQLIAEVKQWDDAPPVEYGSLPQGFDDVDATTFRRRVRRKKGSWWQVPKDLKDEPL